nr:hypothetical protein [Tanacetum cinerariifolium]
MGMDKARAAKKNKGSKASGSSIRNDDALVRLMANEMTTQEKEERLAFKEIKKREVECRERQVASTEYRERQGDIRCPGEACGVISGWLTCGPNGFVISIMKNGILTDLIAELEAMGDADEVFDTLMCLRDDIRDENSKLEGLNDAIAKAKEKIAIKEEHVKTIEAANDHV